MHEHQGPTNPSDVLARAAAYCEQQGTSEGIALAAELRAQTAEAAPASSHQDFALCEELVTWNQNQLATPIRPGYEYQVGMEVLRLARAHQAGSPVLVALTDQTYCVLPRDLPEQMLLALALVSRWSPSDETGEDSDRMAVLEGWNALVALAPTVKVHLPSPAA